MRFTGVGRPGPAVVVAGVLVGVVAAGPAAHARAGETAPGGKAAPGWEAVRSGEAAPARGWVAVWGAAPQRPVAGDGESGPNWSREGFAGESVRQVVRISAGGSRVRIRISNVYGTRPLRVAGAAVGRSAGEARVWPGSTRALRFGGAASTVIPPGREALSDAAPLTTSPLEKLAVTLRFDGATGPATFHRVSTATAYRARGNRLADDAGEAFTRRSASWYHLTGVETSGAGAPRRAVAVFGDSLVDGVGATPGADRTYPDGLAERYAGAGRRVGVVNAGIAGNALLRDSPCFGDRAAKRFRRDVLDRPGVSAVIIHLGGNDIGARKAGNACLRPDPKLSARRLIDAHKALIRAARARGLKAVGVTILPMKGALFPFWSEPGERIRDEVNRWIRTGGAYDEVIDAARVLADPADPDRPRPGHVYADGLHPNDTGYHTLTAATPLTLP
ncbi:SGNH/GDSL hydrolase family protein [Bailinhaonella thermotolerans]|uniref:SGNH/GDSL hydrolase family protein n=1 Tax=Bailinhaonella thermotolerans TaxID=1070861 RepID=UPI00192A352B|nr:SGNH/GDSL hydrolase family protein [Bailinhaonella thermotolerans]